MRLLVLTHPYLPHQAANADAMLSGLRRNGETATWASSEIDAPTLSLPDAVVLWGWRKGEKWRRLGVPVLVMERGYLGDRTAWTSLAWNGLNGRGVASSAADPARFLRHFPDLLKPWRENEEGYVLLIGQLPGDLAVRHMDFNAWATLTAAGLGSYGFDVRYRPHPLAELAVPAALTGVRLMAERSLRAALEGAASCVTFNSNAAVEAVLAGVPTYAIDRGSIAWDVAAHSIYEPPVRPGREDWAARLAWRQWTAEEIAAGDAWALMKGAMPDGHDDEKR